MLGLAGDKKPARSKPLDKAFEDRLRRLGP
jgi:hypothetical protein